MDIDQLSALHRLHLPKIKLGLTRWMAQMRHIVIDGLLIWVCQIKCVSWDHTLRYI